MMVLRLAKAGEARSVERVSEHLHENFSGTGSYLGGDKNALKRGLQLFFIRRSEIFILPHVRSVEVNEEQTHATLRLWVVVSRTRVNFENLTIDLRGQVLDLNATLFYENEWRVQTARWKK
ncbi:MAG: hypothetical protein ACPGQS_14160, partial [Bradymonadia bacterium]